MTPRLVVIGGGRMGSALVGGLIASGWAPSDLTVVDKLDRALRSVSDAHPGVEVATVPVAPSSVVLAVKPQDAEEACRQISGASRVLSIVAGLPTARIEGWLGARAEVVRAMPNTAAQVRAAVSAVAPGSLAGEDTMAWAEGILGSVGHVVRVEEGMLDAVTGLSGSGPAWVFLVAEALVEAGVRNGLPSAASQVLAYQTIAGAAHLLVETGETAEHLRAAVTSPGGTTAAGLSVLESRGVRSALIEAITAATARAAELGRS